MSFQKSKNIFIIAMIISLAFIITIDFVEGTRSEVFMRCLNDMATYCNNEEPRALDCAKWAILDYRAETPKPECIRQYFEESIYPNILIPVIPTPESFCHIFGLNQSTLRESNEDKIKNSKSLQDHFEDDDIEEINFERNCLVNLADFRVSNRRPLIEYLNGEGYCTDILQTAFFGKNIELYPDNVIARKFLRSVSEAIDFKKEKTLCRHQKNFVSHLAKKNHPITSRKGYNKFRM